MSAVFGYDENIPIYILTGSKFFEFLVQCRIPQFQPPLNEISLNKICVVTMVNTLALDNAS